MPGEFEPFENPQLADPAVRGRVVIPETAYLSSGSRLTGEWAVSGILSPKLSA